MRKLRGRAHYIISAVGVGMLGLGTRPLKRLSDSLGSELGDCLWAVLVYLVIVIAFPRLRPFWAWGLATIFAWLVEVSQLWHTGWLDTVRQTTIGGLAIGGTFSWSDLWCYLAGTSLVFFIERQRGLISRGTTM